MHALLLLSLLQLWHNQMVHHNSLLSYMIFYTPDLLHIIPPLSFH